MQFNKFLEEEYNTPVITPNTIDKIEDIASITGKTDSEYFNIIDEDTGFRFNIPMMDSGAPGYYYSYVSAMKLRERSPETFEQMMLWN